jgi:5-methylcytosine-specific restriction endonuclease McrA
LPALFERAVDCLIEREEKRRYAVHSPEACTPERAGSLRRSRPARLRDMDVSGPAMPLKPSPDLPDSIYLPQRPPASCAQDPDPAELMRNSNDQPRDRQRTRHRSSGSEPPCDWKSIRSLDLAKEFSRHIPAAVRRAVWERDRGQCTFVDDEGNRCTERRFLQIDHVDPYARGGATSIGNCCLICRAHNLHRAQLVYGNEFMKNVGSRSRTG